MRKLPPACVLVSLLFLMAQPAPGQHAELRHLNQVHELTLYETAQEWLGRAAWLRDQIRISNGLWPAPEKTSLNPQYAPSKSFKDYSVQGVTLETMPGFFLTGTLFIPTGEGPFPGVLSPHGHWSAGRFEHGEQASIPGRAIHLAQQGFVVFNYSMIGYNEYEGLFPHRFDSAAYQLWGFSASGLQTWNSLRALDFVSELPFVDGDRMGMTGASGGGTQTFLLTAIDERIKVAAPVNMISAHFQGGCICENAPAMRIHTNNVEIGALAAPRPLLMISTSGDWTTNTPEVEYPAIKEIYRLFDAEDHVSNVHLDFPHNYNEDSRNAMYQWFGKWLADEESTKMERLKKMPAEKHLRAPALLKTLTVDELFEAYKTAETLRQTASAPTSWATLDAYHAQFKTPINHVLHGTHTPVEFELEIITPNKRISSSDASLIVYGNKPEDRNEAEQIARDLTERGMIAALINPFTLISSSPVPDSIAYPTTYNNTSAQQRIQLIQRAARALKMREDVSNIDLHSIGDAGPLTFLARAQLPFIRHTHIDFNGKRFDEDQEFIEALNIPLLRKAGDFKTVATLTFPSSLTIQSLPHGTLKNWIFSLYASFDALERLTFVP